MTIPKDIVARATIKFDTGKVVYVEIKSKPTFYAFYTLSLVGEKRNQKKELVMASLNQGQANGIEEAARKIAERIWKGCGSRCITKIVIYRKKEYRRLLDTPPDELGLTKCSRQAPIPWSPRAGRIPVGYTSLQKRMDIINPRR
jgi:hypothetical protein